MPTDPLEILSKRPQARKHDMPPGREKDPKRINHLAFLAHRISGFNQKISPLGREFPLAPEIFWVKWDFSSQQNPLEGRGNKGWGNNLKMRGIESRMGWSAFFSFAAFLCVCFASSFFASYPKSLKRCERGRREGERESSFQWDNEKKPNRYWCQLMVPWLHCARDASQ